MTIQSSDNQVAHVVYFKSFEAIQLLCVKNRLICYFTVNLPLCWSSEICHDDASFHQCHQMRFAWCRIREDFLWIMTSISVGSSCIIRLQKTCNMAHKSHYRTHFCAFWSLTDMNWIFEVTSKKKKGKHSHVMFHRKKRSPWGRIQMKELSFWTVPLKRFNVLLFCVTFCIDSCSSMYYLTCLLKA